MGKKARHWADRSVVGSAASSVEKMVALKVDGWVEQSVVTTAVDWADQLAVRLVDQTVEQLVVQWALPTAARRAEPLVANWVGSSGCKLAGLLASLMVHLKVAPTVHWRAGYSVGMSAPHLVGARAGY